VALHPHELETVCVARALVEVVPDVSWARQVPSAPLPPSVAVDGEPSIAVPYGTYWETAAGQGGVPVGVAATPSSSSSCGYWAGEASTAGSPCNGEQSYAPHVDGLPGSRGQRSGKPRRPELVGQLGLRLTI
jgi:hypothetical protein